MPKAKKGAGEAAQMDLVYDSNKSNEGKKGFSVGSPKEVRVPGGENPPETPVEKVVAVQPDGTEVTVKDTDHGLEFTGLAKPDDPGEEYHGRKPKREENPRKLFFR